jgi:hypothetical protein
MQHGNVNVKFVSVFTNGPLLQVCVFSQIFPIQALTSCSLRLASVVCTHLCPVFQSVLFLCSQTNLYAQFNISSTCDLHHISIIQSHFIIVL